MVLPVIVRELRVRARSGGVAYVRMAAAALFVLLAGLVGVPAMLAGARAGGQMVFAVLGWMLMMYALFEGARIASSVISEERRDGTLGLLFLTDLTALDVLLGKLAGAAVTAFFSLLAMVPVLSVAVLLGGVTAGELVRGSVTLVNALILSLAAGLWSSARSREGLVSLLVALGVVMALTTAPLLVEMMIRLVFSETVTGFEASAGLFSPVVTMILAQDASYQSAPVRFWVGQAMQLGTALALVRGAARWLGASWREEVRDVGRAGPGANSTAVSGPAAEGPAVVSPATAGAPLPGREVDGTDQGRGAIRSGRSWFHPARRRRDPGAVPEVVVRSSFGDRMNVRFWGRVLVAMAAFAQLPQLLVPLTMSVGGAGSVLMILMGLLSLPGLFCSLGGLLLIVYLPARAVGEARHTGELELLLTTPLGHREYLGHLWQNLRPVVGALAVVVGLTALGASVLVRFSAPALAQGGGQAGWILVPIQVATAAAHAWFGNLALIWTAFWFALRVRKLPVAIGLTFGLVAILTPAVTSVIGVVSMLQFGSMLAGDGAEAVTILSGLVGLVGPILWYRWARARLDRSFREIAAGAY